MEKKQTAVDLLVSILNKEGYICPQTKKQCDDECCVSAEDCHIKVSIGILSESKQETLEVKMSKQTAVEWLENQLKDVKYNRLEKNGYTNAVNNLYIQAKQMEKEQIVDAWYDGISGGQCGTSEEYYNETYGGNNE